MTLLILLHQLWYEKMKSHFDGVKKNKKAPTA
jgi:hypothetical protein